MSLPSRKRGFETVMRLSVVFGNSSISPRMAGSPGRCKMTEYAIPIPFQKRSDISQQDLDLEFSQCDNITMTEGLLHVRINATSVYIGSVRGAEIHYHHTVRIPFHDRVEAG